MSIIAVCHAFRCILDLPEDDLDLDREIEYAFDTDSLSRRSA